MLIQSLIKDILTMNIAKVIFDVDGTLVVKREGGDTSLTLLGKALVKLGVPIRVMSVTSHWNTTTLCAMGLNVCEFRVAEFGSTLSIDDNGTQCKVVAPDETLVDDYYGVAGGTLIRYNESTDERMTQKGCF